MLENRGSTSIVPIPKSTNIRLISKVQSILDLPLGLQGILRGFRIHQQTESEEIDG